MSRAGMSLEGLLEMSWDFHYVEDVLGLGVSLRFYRSSEVLGGSTIMMVIQRKGREQITRTRARQ